MENSETIGDDITYTELQPPSLLCGQRTSTQIETFDSIAYDHNDSMLRQFILSSDGNDGLLSNELSYVDPHLIDPTQIILQRIEDGCNGLPRDQFIQKLSELCNNDISTLEQTRLQYFKVAKLRSDFPYQNSVLKKRANPKSKNGESLTHKLSKDCFALRLASKGEICDELKDAFNLRSLTTSVSRDDSVSATFASNDDNFRHTLVKIESSIVEMKINFQKEKLDMTNRLDEMTKSNDKLIGVINKQKERMHNFQTQISVIRSSNEKCQSRVLELEKQLAESREKENTLSNNISEMNKILEGSKSDFSNLSKSVIENTESITKTKSKLDSTASLTISNQKQLKTESLRISQISDAKASGVSSIRAKVQLLNEQMKDMSSSLDTVSPKVDSFCSSITDIRKRVNTIEKRVSQTNSDTKTYACVTSTVCTDAATQSIPPPNDGEENVIQVNRVVKPTLENVSEKAPTVTDTQTHDQAQRKLPSEMSKRIPIHFPRSVCNNQPPEFKGVVRKTKRISRFYVGGMDKLRSSEQAMRNHLAENNVRVTFLRYFSRPYKRTASAQLNINADDESIILSDYFWPEGMFLKPWLPWEQFAKEHNINHNHGYK